MGTRSVRLVATGVCLGFGLGIMTNRDRNRKYQTEVKLKTDLLNWIIGEGLAMPDEEFFPALAEKTRFINIAGRLINDA